ncbi:unnamed protein product [Haemonchus placei]|uniref:Uncharacterized protein n=1 Tax=Haemonchus placei TaxID=6290 RepID=A0A3P7YJK6_HAEPC|nr:unnamed protein product [Haemonchus placei]
MTWFSPAAATPDLCDSISDPSQYIRTRKGRLIGRTTEMTISGNLDWKDKTSLGIMHFHVEFR